MRVLRRDVYSSYCGVTSDLGLHASWAGFNHPSVLLSVQRRMKCDCQKRDFVSAVHASVQGEESYCSWLLKRTSTSVHKWLLCLLQRLTRQLG